MITITQVDNTYQIKFNYDPILVDKIKLVPGRRWVPENKYWEISTDKLGFFLKQIKGTVYESTCKIISNESLYENAKIEETSIIPNVDISKLHYYVKPNQKPYTHQLDFMKYAISRQLDGNYHGFLVGDDMGCISGDMHIKLYDGVREYYPTLREAFIYYKLACSEDATYKYLYDMNIIKSLDVPKSSKLETLSLRELSGNVKLHKIISIIFKGFQYTYKITLESGKSLRCTADHPIYTPNGYRLLETLKENDLVGVDTKFHISTPNHITIGKLKYEKITSIEFYGFEDVYDIQMDSPHHNFVTNGVIVHNCGKTNEATNLALYNRKSNKFKHCLIICNINTSKYNWEKEINGLDQCKDSAYILGSRKKKDGSISYNITGKQKLEDLRYGHMYGNKDEPKLPYFLITNVESLRIKEGRKYPFTEMIIDMIQSGNLNMIIIDEIHKNMSPTSMQGKQMLKIKKATGSSCMYLPMTGTPIVKKPTDAFLPLKLVDAHNFNSYYTWCKEFCVYGGYGGYEILGYKNIPKLKAMLQCNMIRRLKSQVLDLPPVIKFDEYVENTPYQQKLYDSVRLSLLAEINQIIDVSNPMAKLLRLRQVNGSPELIDTDLQVDKDYLKYNAKVKRLVELVDEIHERGEKVIIFSNWVEPLRMLYKVLHSKYKNICSFTGTMQDVDREKHKELFQNNPNYTILLGTIGAAGTTHTFTAATNVIFLDEPFNAADKQQAIDRTNRIGTTSSVNVYTLLTKNTIDEKVHEIVYEKGMTADYIVDNKLDFKNNPKLIYKLLGSDSDKL